MMRKCKVSMRVSDNKRRMMQVPLKGEEKNPKQKQVEKEKMDQQKESEREKAIEGSFCFE